MDAAIDWARADAGDDRGHRRQIPEARSPAFSLRKETAQKSRVGKRLAKPPGEIGEASEKLSIVARNAAVGQLQVILEADPHISAQCGGTKSAFDFPGSERTDCPTYILGDVIRCVLGGREGEKIAEARSLS